MKKVIFAIFLISVLLVTACNSKNIGSDTNNAELSQSPDDLSEVNSLDQDLNYTIDDLNIGLNEEDII